MGVESHEPAGTPVSLADRPTLHLGLAWLAGTTAPFAKRQRDKWGQPEKLFHSQGGSPESDRLLRGWSGGLRVPLPSPQARRRGRPGLVRVREGHVSATAVCPVTRANMPGPVPSTAQPRPSTARTQTDTQHCNFCSFIIKNTESKVDWGQGREAGGLAASSRRGAPVPVPTRQWPCTIYIYIEYIENTGKAGRNGLRRNVSSPPPGAGGGSRLIHLVLACPVAEARGGGSDRRNVFYCQV